MGPSQLPEGSLLTTLASFSDLPTLVGPNEVPRSSYTGAAKVLILRCPPTVSSTKDQSLSQFCGHMGQLQLTQPQGWVTLSAYRQQKTAKQPTGASICRRRGTQTRTQSH